MRHSITERTLADTAHEILADPTRRALLRVLTADRGGMALTELVRRLAERPVGPADERALRLRLYHCHLPKLAAAGAVNHDWADGEVRLTPAGRRVETVRRETAELLEPA